MGASAGDTAMTLGGFFGGAAEGLIAGHVTGAFDGPEVDLPAEDPEEDEEGARARQREIERLRRKGARGTQLTGSVSEALSAPVGKRTLGGAT